MKFSIDLEILFDDINEIVTEMRHEYITPEHALLCLLYQMEFADIMTDFDTDPDEMEIALKDYLDRNLDRIPRRCDTEHLTSQYFTMMLSYAKNMMLSAEKDMITLPMFVETFFYLPDSFAHNILEKVVGDNRSEFIQQVIQAYEDDEEDEDNPEDGNSDDDPARFNYFQSLAEAIAGIGKMQHGDISRQEDGEDEEYEDHSAPKPQQGNERWRKLVTCVNDTVDHHNPLIGRKEEMERTIQILCRKEKNNPLHIGEPGVGKTSMAYGLARLINEGKVPERLKGSRIYLLNIGDLLAGTQYRGDFEKRIKLLMEGTSEEGNAIIYIDEIHNIVGTGQIGDSSMDASNMLKPFFESGKVRFIGSTTYAEYNRYIAQHQGLARRFQRVDIKEPSTEETIHILQQLKEKYEDFHHVAYTDEAIELAVKASDKFINDRCLPDKAIDLIDEAGAYVVTHHDDNESHEKEDDRLVVDKAIIIDILAKVCKVDANIMTEEDNGSMQTLQKRILSKVYGQDKAVEQVCTAVQMAKAGLGDDSKPIASLLFVGPTGVGKTEIAKVLAHELGISLVRFDMSEYTDEYTVSKLIGSAAGYVGYEDGGLLTNAIRKTPNCVLLLDEIEKAHRNIYNVLLQVMDYANLTDNRGNKVDFRNVILLMTSNAGAQYAHQANIGFGNTTTAGNAMMGQVKKTFTPEFINRLNGIIVFNDMDDTMAGLILDKKLGELNEKLKAKKVTMTLSEDARRHLLKRGITREYGAREIDRVINAELKPLLMREILYGRLKEGGDICLGCKDDKLYII